MTTGGKFKTVVFDTDPTQFAYKWPATDTDCMNVVHRMLPDLDEAMKLVPGRNVVVQAGGNCGVWPKHLAKSFKMVYTFEAEPTNYECLVSNCNESNITTFWGALGASGTDSVGMEAPEGDRNMGACRVDGPGMIPCYRIDSLPLRACDFIQLDVEGYEYQVLLGAHSIIERFHPVIMVEDKGLSEKYHQPNGWSQQYMSKLGYVVAERLNRDIVYVYKG